MHIMARSRNINERGADYRFGGDLSFGTPTTDPRRSAPGGQGGGRGFDRASEGFHRHDSPGLEPTRAGGSNPAGARRSIAGFARFEASPSTAIQQSGSKTHYCGKSCTTRS